MVEIRLACKDEEEIWKKYVITHPHSMIYHLPDWTNVAQEGFNHKSHLLLAWRYGMIAGGLPLFTNRLPFKKQAVSVSLRDKGGPLFDDSDVLEALLQSSLSLLPQLGASSLELRTGIDLPEVSSLKSFIKFYPRHEVTIDLTGSWSDIQKRMDPTRIRNWRRALKCGLEFRIAKDITEWQSFYKLFVLTRKKLGIPPFPWKLFQSIKKWLTPEYATLFMAYLKEYPVAGVVTFHIGDTVSYGYVSSETDSERLKSRPNDFLIMEILKWAHDRRYKTFQFGGDSHHLQSLIKYKMKWGGKINPLTSYFYTSGGRLPNSIYDIQSKWLRYLLSHCPTEVLKILGKSITSFLT